MTKSSWPLPGLVSRPLPVGLSQPHHHLRPWPSAEPFWNKPILLMRHRKNFTAERESPGSTITTAEITSKQYDYVTPNYNSPFWLQHEETVYMFLSPPPDCQLAQQPSPSEGQSCLCYSTLGNLSELVFFQDKTFFKALFKALTLWHKTKTGGQKSQGNYPLPCPRRMAFWLIYFGH